MFSRTNADGYTKQVIFDFKSHSCHKHPSRFSFHKIYEMCVVSAFLGGTTNSVKPIRTVLKSENGCQTSLLNCLGNSTSTTFKTLCFLNFRVGRQSRLSFLKPSTVSPDWFLIVFKISFSHPSPINIYGLPSPIHGAPQDGEMGPWKYPKQPHPLP